MKRWLLVLGPIFVTVAALSGLFQYLKPQFETLVHRELQFFLNKKAPIPIQLEALHFDLFLPQASLEKIVLQIPASEKIAATELRIERVTAKLDLLALLAGRVQLSSILIQTPSAHIDLDPLLAQESHPQLIDWSPFFKLLRKLPVIRIVLKDTHLKFQSLSRDLNLEFLDLDALIINEKDRLQVRVDLQDAQFRWAKLSSPLRAQIDATLSPQGLDLTEVRLLGFGSLLKASGGFSNISSLWLAPDGFAQIDLKGSLPQVSALLARVKNAPILVGDLEVSGSLEVKQGSLTNAGFRIFGKDLKVDQFEIGQVETDGRFFNDVLQVKKLSLTHPAGLIDVSDLTVDVHRKNGHLDSGDVKAHIRTEILDLHDLLAGLGVGDLPLELLIGAELDCQGPAFPTFTLSCKGSATGDQFEVRSGPNQKDVIVALGEFGVEGALNIDLEKVSYEALAHLGKNAVTSRGVISYSTGFEIQYHAPSVELSDIENLANFSMSGRAKLKGETRGNASAATFQIQAEGEDIWFENFYLGAPKTLISYKKGILAFNEILGLAKSSLYSGSLNVDLNQLTLDGKFKSDRLEMSDAQFVLSRNVPFPFDVSGVGSGSVEISGPLKLNALTYDARAQLSRIVAAGENFEKVDIAVQSREGHFQINRALATKAGHSLQMTGTGEPSGEIQFLLEGRDLPLEQSENIALLNANISGLLDFTLAFTDQIRKPHLLLKAKARNLVADEQEIPATESELLIAPGFLRGKTNLVGGRLQATFQFPFDETQEFELSLKAKDWNPTTFFALIGSGPLLSEYQSSLTGNLNLKAQKGGFWKSSGEGTIDQYFLRRGGLSLQNSGPMKMSVQNGQFSFENFKLMGPQTFAELQGVGSTRENLGLTIKAQTDLRLLQIFLPFLEELSGKAQGTMTLVGPLTKPQILGSATSDSAYVKIRGFPHAFEKIDSTVQFSQSRVVISSAKGELAGGVFSLDGGVSIQGVHDFPTQIHAKVQNVSLNVPDKIRTTGNGDLVLSGNWFPFTLSGNYQVSGGLIEKEFGEDQAQSRVQKSSYLPKMILQKAFEPILLDLSVQIPQPLMIKNSLANGSITGQLQVKGPVQNPGLLGQVSTEKGTLAQVRDKSFEVISATVKFADLKEINPELYVSARSRVNEYDISMLVQGHAKNPLVRMTSLPPLSEQDIVSLLALGVTTEKTDKRFQPKETQSDGAFQIGSALIQQVPLVQKAQKATGMNVQLSSNYDDTKNVEVKKISISRQVTEKIKASASRLVGDQGSNEFKIEYNFNSSVSAIGTYQQKEPTERSNLSTTQKQEDSILGLDLEFRKEFH